MLVGRFDLECDLDDGIERLLSLRLKVCPCIEDKLIYSGAKGERGRVKEICASAVRIGDTRSEINKFRFKFLQHDGNTGTRFAQAGVKNCHNRFANR